MPHRDDFDDDLMDASSNAYDYKPVSSNEAGGGKAVKLFLSVTVIAALAGGAWYFVGGMQETGDNVPVVRAETTATKIKPVEPGGMDVPNRDKTVYDRVSGENTEPKLEKLLPRPEKPLEKPSTGMALPELSEKVSAATGLPAITKELPPVPKPIEVDKAPEPVAAPTVVENKPPLPAVPSEDMVKSIEAPPPAPVADENAPRALVKRGDKPVKPAALDQDALAAKIADALKENPSVDAKPEVKKPVEIAKVPAKPVVPKKGYALQLLSSKSQSGVKAAWLKIKSKNGDILKSLPQTIVKADLGDKGIYYRLRLGPVATGENAKKICSKLKQRNVGCFIVRLR